MNNIVIADKKEFVLGEIELGNFTNDSIVFMKDSSDLWSEGTYFGTCMIETTYDELVQLVESKALVPGRQYRITDYITTTSQEGTISAGNQFDIIVTADSNSVLNENARAIHHEGDTYFANSDLSSWQLWYTIYNNTNCHCWADNDTGKGVIYRMIDEYNNDCPYDFKNIKFVRFLVDTENEHITDKTIFDNKYVGYKSKWDTALPAGITNRIDDVKYFYTFSLSNGNDNSLSWAKNNTIRTDRKTKTRYWLNNIVLIDSGTIASEQNIFEAVVYDITIWTTRGSCRNTFGYNSQHNIIISDEDVQFNFFEGYFYSNLMCSKTDITRNCFNAHMENNLIVCNEAINLNQIGSQFNSNIILNKFIANIIGAGFCNNKCTSLGQNVIDVFCNGNTFNSVLNCNIGAMFQNNVLNDVTACSFGIGFRGNTFKQALNGDHRGNIKGCIFGNYIWFNNFYNSDTASPIKNLTVQSYLQGTESAYNNIEVPVNTDYETKIAKNSSGVIKVYCEADLVN